MTIDKSLFIVLTGTIKPAVKGGNFTEDERQSMYENTLQFYSRSIGKEYPIFFVENSNADLSSWDTKFKESLDLRIVQFNPNEYCSGFDNSKGKGYNEYLMIAKLVDLIPVHNDHCFFLKITGRYSMLNIHRIIREIKRKAINHEKEFLGDVKDTRIYEMFGKDTLSSHWGDSRFFAANLGFYRENLKSCYLEMNDYISGHWAEDYFLRLSRRFRNDRRFSFRFRTQVLFDGVSGTLNSDQLRNGVGRQNSTTNIIKANIRGLLRILFPFVWF